MIRAADGWSNLQSPISEPLTIIGKRAVTKMDKLDMPGGELGRGRDALEARGGRGDKEGVRRACLKRGGDEGWLVKEFTWIIIHENVEFKRAWEMWFFFSERSNEFTQHMTCAHEPRKR